MKLKHSGFTIVELLIVIVVIAILAAITIVAYNGIQRRADDSARQSEAGQFKRLAEIRNVDSLSYICSTCSSSAQISTAYKATSLIPTKADVYMWGSIYASPPSFDKKKLAIIHDNLNYQWMSVSHWSNATNAWITTTYTDYGDGNPTIVTESAASPMPLD